MTLVLGIFLCSCYHHYWHGRRANFWAASNSNVIKHISTASLRIRRSSPPSATWGHSMPCNRSHL